jgi:hypothetical protein
MNVVTAAARAGFVLCRQAAGQIVAPLEPSA